MALPVPISSISLPASKLKAFESLYGLKSFHLPELSSTLPVRVHPDFVSLSRAADDWICTHLRITDDNPRKKELKEKRMPLFNNLVNPFGDFEKALACCKYILTLFIVDDPFDDDEAEKPKKSEALALLQSLMSIARGTMTKDECAGNPVLEAWEDMISDMRKLMPYPVYNRFLATNQAWTDSIFGMSELSVPAYIQYRRDNAAVDPCFCLLELCLGICLKDQDLDCPDLTSARRAVNDSIWLVNDLLSIQKDRYYKSLNNIQFALLSTDPTIHNFQEAVNRVRSMIEQVEEEFIFYHDIVLSKAREAGNKDLIKFMEGLRFMIPGNIVFHNLSARYHGASNPIVKGDILHGTWDLTDTKLTMIDLKSATGEKGKYYDLLAL